MTKHFKYPEEVKTENVETLLRQFLRNQTSRERTKMRESIKQVLMRRDEMSEEEAEDLIAEAREDLFQRLDDGEEPYDICFDWFGLEPDYLDELLMP